ncbi:MAG: hypothetical protein WC708_07225 [Lentisphaeria bacterium]
MRLPSLTSRAALAVNCLTRHGDPARGYLPYFYTLLNDRPVSAALQIWSYGDGLGRAVDALTLLRAMTGGTVEGPDDRTLRALLIGLIGTDGLSWCPAEPWLMDVPHTRPAWLQQGTLLALTSLYQFTGDPEYRELAERNILAVAAMARPSAFGDAEFPGDHYTRRDGWAPLPTDPMHRHSVFSTSITMPLMRYYRLTGFAPALELASKLIGWALRDHDGGNALFERGHFHCQSRLVIALLLHGLAAGRPADVALAERLYRKARALGTSTGWFPEQINNPEHNRSNLSETCCLTDMLELAVLLAQHVNPAYWHDAERYARNHLLVHQITGTDWLANASAVPRSEHALGYNHEAKRRGEGIEEGPRLLQSILGGFAGWGAVTAMSDDTSLANSNQQCCNAAGARALYDAWYYAVTDDGREFRVNLHLARRHPAAEVRVDGDAARETVTVRLAAARDAVRIRIPEFLAAAEVSAACNGRPLALAAGDDGFLAVGPAAAGSELRFSWPLKPRVSKERIAPGEFTFHWAGATVTAAEPVQALGPLFVPGRFATGPAAPEPLPACDLPPL